MPTSETTSPSHPPSSDTLQSFTLDDLAQYTREGAFGPSASPDFRVFYVGRDDVHGVLVHLFSRVKLSVKMNVRLRRRAQPAAVRLGAGGRGR
jgi:hypothetical protein